jgi:hypothetical protein
MVLGKVCRTFSIVEIKMLTKNNPFPGNHITENSRKMFPLQRKNGCLHVAVTTVIKALQALTKCILMDDWGIIKILTQRHTTAHLIRPPVHKNNCFQTENEMLSTVSPLPLYF